MPLLRRDDQARNHRPDGVTGFHEDRRPAPPRLTEPRNGIPTWARRPYTYQGSGADVLTPEMDGDPATCVAPVRALSRLALLDVCEATAPPRWDDWRELRDTAGLDPWAGVA